MELEGSDALGMRLIKNTICIIGDVDKMLLGNGSENKMLEQCLWAPQTDFSEVAA